MFPAGLAFRAEQPDSIFQQSKESFGAAGAAWGQAELQLTSWSAMAGLCARKITNPGWDHESLLVSVVEDLEAISQEQTLCSWILEKACDATTMDDDSPETWFRILRAAEDVALSTRKAPEPRCVPMSARGEWSTGNGWWMQVLRWS